MNKRLGYSAIVLAIAFNVPYAILAATYEYPQVLRMGAAHALDRFAAGGTMLVLTWYAFGLTAFALIPMAIALAITPTRIAAHPARTITAAMTGALSGLAQAIGLWRWVFVVPELARAHAASDASPAARSASEAAFAVLNQYGGVAVGEHLGQMLLAIFVLLLASLQQGERSRVASALGIGTALLLAVGTGEGLALAIGQPGELFSIATIVGFLGLSAWLIATGVGLIRSASHPGS